MKGCKNLCNKKTPHIDGVKVLRVPAWERGSICPALVPTPCIIKWKENLNIEDLQQESSYSNSIQLSNSVLRSYRSVCIRYSNLMLIKTSRDSVLIRTIYYPFYVPLTLWHCVHLKPIIKGCWFLLFYLLIKHIKIV